eukprot:COSAG06_NODE_52409_length_306_cov_0.323671_1_plen_67_part_10
MLPIKPSCARGVLADVLCALARSRVTESQVLAVPVSLLTLILLVFLGFHTYLSCSGQTTKAIVREVR